MAAVANEPNPPLGRVLMVQGTASHVGKSVLVSALCRILRQDGLRVAPFKAQNMSNNSYVTPDGAEIGRAQAVQAEAAGVEARAEMNPVLLKPEADSHAQVVLMGRPLTSARARDYFDLKATLWESVAQSLDTLRREYDVVVIEGAGSPAEINLKATEIVNMRVALHADAPVLLCGDIDRGGVFASLVGTLQLLDDAERAAVKGMLINKFRGDVSLLTDGLTWLEDYTGKPVVGVVHHFRDIHIPEEDSVALEITPPTSSAAAVLDVAVVQVPHISNFDDFDPLAREPGVALRYVQHGDRLGNPDLVILPGSKTTIPDLLWMERQGVSRALTDAVARGASVIGMQAAGEIPNSEASIAKMFSTELSQRIARTAIKMLGTAGQLRAGENAPFEGRLGAAYVASASATIAGGTSEIQRNIIATRGLGLPRA